jgi:hypothetical protein
MANPTAFSGKDVMFSLTAAGPAGAGATTEILEGFAGVSDAIKFDESQEIVTYREGMDGYLFFAQTGRQGGVVTIKMLPSSPKLGFLFTNAQLQKSGMNISWAGKLVLVSQKINAVLDKGMMLTYPTFATIGMNNIDDYQFSFYFAVINSTFDQFDGNIFAGGQLVGAT